MAKDKSYIGQVDGIPFRVRAAKKPDLETQEALKAMVKIAYNKKKNSTKEVERV